MLKMLSEILFENTGRTLSRIALASFFPLEIRGRENIPKGSCVILAGNHTGLLDTPVIATAFPCRLRFFMHESVYCWPLIGRLMHLAPVIPYSPGKELVAIRQSLDVLGRGQSLCIFPEGKLSKNGQLAEFGPGVALLHQKSRRPILPFCIEGGYEAWSWENRLSPTPGPIRITFGPIIPATEKSRLETLHILKERIRDLSGRKIPQTERAC